MIYIQMHLPALFALFAIAKATQGTDEPVVIWKEPDADIVPYDSFAEEEVKDMQEEFFDQAFRFYSLFRQGAHLEVKDIQEQILQSQSSQNRANVVLEASPEASPEASAEESPEASPDVKALLPPVRHHSALKKPFRSWMPAWLDWRVEPEASLVGGA